MATRTISTKLAIEGEAEYKSALKNCNAELKAMESQLKLVESRYQGQANSQEALKAKVQALSGVLETQKSKVDTLKDALTNAQSVQQTYADKVASIKQELESLDTSSEGAAESQEKLEASLTEAQAGYDAATRSVNGWQTKLNNAEADLNNTNAELKANNTYLAEAEASTDKCAHSIDEYGKTVKETGEKSEEFGKKSSTAVDSFAAALAASGIKAGLSQIREALNACVEAATNFETATAKVSTLVDTSSVDMSAMSAAIKDLSNETGKYATELEEAAYEAISAGVDAADAASFTGIATKLSVGGFTDAATAVDVLTTALNAYGLQSSDTQKVADMLIVTQNLGKTTVDELAQSLGTVIPIAAAYGVNLENLSSAYAVMTAGGIDTARATTSLKAVLNELADTGSTVSGVLSEQTGKSFSELNAAGYSLGDVLEILGDSVGGNATAFSNLWNSTEAGTGALSLMNAGAEKFNETLVAMQNSTGAADDAYNTMANTAEGAANRLSASFENLKIAVGDQLNPAIEQMSEVGANVLQWATDFIQANEWLVPAITGVIVALSGLATAFAIYTIIDKLSESIGKFFDLISDNPVILIITALTAVTVALVAYSATLEDANKATRELIDSTKESAKAYADLQSEIDTQNADTNNLMASLTNLMGVENKSAAQKMQIVELVNQLNKAMPELSLAYDEQTDSLNMTTDALIEYVKAQQNKEKAVEATKRLIELQQEEIDLNEQLAAAQAEVDKNGELAVYGMTPAKSQAAIRVDELTAAIAGNKNEQADAQTVMESYTATTESYTATTEKAAEKTTEYATAVDESSRSLAESYYAAYDDAKESLEGQADLFEGVKDAAKTSIEEIIQSMKDQADASFNYASNIQSAMEMGIDKGLIEKLSDGSEQSKLILQEIVDGGQKKVDELNAEFARTQEGTDAAAAAVAKLETQIKIEMDGAVDDTRDALGNLKPAMVNAAKYAVDGFVGELGRREVDVKRAAAEVAAAAEKGLANRLEEKSPSKVTEKIGKYFIDGFIVGIESKKKELENTIKEVGETIQQTLDEAVADYYKEQYDTAYEGLDRTLGLFEKVEQPTLPSFTDLIGAVQSQQAWLDTYAANLQKAKEMGVNEDLLAQLSDGSEKSAEYLQTIVTGSADQITALNESMAKLETGKESMAKLAASITGALDENLAGLEETAKENVTKAVEAMDQSEAAAESGKATVQGLIDGADSLKPQLVAKFKEIAAAGMQGYNDQSGIASPSKEMAKSGRFTMQGLILGIEESQPDLVKALEESAKAASYAAEHAIPKGYEKALGSMSVSNMSSSTVNNSTQTVVVNSPKALTPSEIARETRNAMRRMSWER